MVEFEGFAVEKRFLAHRALVVLLLANQLMPAIELTSLVGLSLSPVAFEGWVIHRGGASDDDMPLN